MFILILWEGQIMNARSEYKHAFMPTKVKSRVQIKSGKIS